MNGVIGVGATLAMMLLVGISVGVTDRRHFSPTWLGIAAGLVAFNDLLLTRAYGLLPDILGGAWNWEGKFMALAATIAIAAAPAIGWRRAGLTLSQEPGSLRKALPVAALYGAFFLLIAFAFPSEPATGEEIAFQMTLPGLEEEIFYRGLLLFALDRAFTARRTHFGVSWGFGAILSSLLFGIADGLGFSHGTFFFEPLAIALTGIPALLAVWLRLRTGSLMLPVVLHNFGNAISLVI